MKLKVTAMNMTTSGETASASSMFQFTPLASGKTPVVTPSVHPLVAIYSAPPCAIGSRMRIQYSTAGGSPQYTPFQACHPAASMNFYLAGMYQNTPYTAQQVIDTGDSFVTGAPLAFTTGVVGLLPPPVTALTMPPLPTVDGVLVQSLFSGNSIATDLSGKLLWYSPGDITFLTRAVGGGVFLGIGEDDTEDPSQQFVREFDVAGITVAETNAARINQQLSALGMHAINGFHHEARKMPDGQYLVLADSERVLTDVQGPGPVDVIGDTILVLDANLQVTWAWDSFDHLDTHRTAVLGETCIPAARPRVPAVLFEQGGERLAAREFAATHAGRKHPLFRAASGLGDQDRLPQWGGRRRCVVAFREAGRFPDDFVRPQPVVLPPA